jgi:hypothetical protein
MVTIGDVLAVVAMLTGFGVTAWALMVSCGLLFPQKVDAARRAAQNSPWKNFGLGIAVLIPGLLGVPMLGAAPAVKLVGWLLILSVLSIGAIGAAGVGHLAGKSLTRMSGDMPEYPAFVRGCAFIVTASMLPVLGWFVFGPAALLVALGSGAKALAAHSRPPVLASDRT